MTKIKPFKAIRATKDKVQLVASRPYYTYSKENLEAKMSDNPYTFIHIIHPEFKKKNHFSDIYGDGEEKHREIKSKFQEFVEKGILIKEEKESLYIYRQTTENHVFTGVIGGASIDEYKNDKIKKHEDTLEPREKAFTEYLKTVEFIAEPILLFHEKNLEIDKILKDLTLEKPEYKYTTSDLFKHELWVINEEKTVKKIQAIFENMNHVYIADGHHRFASSARLMDDSNGVNPLEKYSLGFFISEEKLNIMDYNRLVKDLNGLTLDEFIEAIKKDFIIEEKFEKIIQSEGLHQMVMYCENKWFTLLVKEGTYNRFDPVENLDTHIISQKILGPILGINDLRNDARIEFLSGNKGMQGLKESVDSNDFKIGFGIFPVSSQQLKNVANANLIMPPKSTWIEPKLRSGLTIYPLNENL